jgi:hypothetical protein
MRTILIAYEPTKYMKNKLSILGWVLTLTVSGCACSSVVPVGANILQPLPQDEPVQIYFDDGQIKKPFTVIAMVSRSDRGKYRMLSLQDIIPDLKDEARKARANGLIITHTEAIKSGIWSRGLAVDAKAIHIEP